VYILPAILERIVEAEREATEMLNNADLKVNDIKKEAEKKAKEVFSETYDNAVVAAEQEAEELKKKAKDLAEFEAKSSKHGAEEKIKLLQGKASKNLDKAVDIVLEEILR
jgi:vacuolar-type H+-ATPase subunit H